jgi:hypothetical protein
MKILKFKIWTNAKAVPHVLSYVKIQMDPTRVVVVLGTIWTVTVNHVMVCTSIVRICIYTTTAK